MSPALWSFTADRVELWILVATRLTGLLSVLPGIGQERIPTTIRAALIALTATILVPVIPRPAHLAQGLWDLIPLLLVELLAGLLMGLVAACVMEAVAFGGQLMDTQMGFSFVQILDPSSGASASVSGALLMQTALLFLFLTGLHHKMILTLVESYRLVPIGAGVPIHPQEVVGLVGQLLARGFQLAMPILITLFFVDVLEGLAAKMLPQLQLIQLAFPLKISVGLALFLVLMREFPSWIAPLYERVPADALRLLK